MDITHKAFKRVDLVTVSGRVDGNTAPDLEAVLRAINDEGRFRIVLDMAGVEYLSSAALRVMVSTLKNCRRYNRGGVHLASVPKRIADVLELAGLDTLFTTYPDAVEAVGSF